MERNPTADLLKGLAVIFMIQVHLLELYATPDIYASLIGKVSLFMGGPPAAPVFMVVMGFYFAMSKKSWISGIKRGVKLILLGFILNIGLNTHLFIKIANGSIIVSPWPYLFGVDILFLAGLSIIILSVLKHYFKFNMLPYLFLLASIFAGQLFLYPISSVEPIHYLLAYVFGDGIWWSYFPLIPWLAYPALGFILYILKDRFAELYQKFRLPLLLISGVVSFIFIGYGADIAASLPGYYHHGVLFFLYTCVFLIFYSIIVDIISNTKKTWFSRWVAWLGENVTAAYVIQWLLIGNITTAIYRTQGYVQLISWFTIILILVSVGIFCWLGIKKYIDIKASN